MKKAIHQTNKDYNSAATKGDFFDIEKKLEKMDAKINNQMQFLLQTIDGKISNAKEGLIIEIGIRFSRMKDDHAELMTFLNEHFPIQQKQVYEHEVRITKIEQVLQLSA